MVDQVDIIYIVSSAKLILGIRCETNANALTPRWRYDKNYVYFKVANLGEPAYCAQEIGKQRIGGISRSRNVTAIDPQL